MLSAKRRREQCYAYCECYKCIALRRRASLCARGLCLTCEVTSTERGKLNCRACLDVKRAHYNDVLRNQINFVIARIVKSADQREIKMLLSRRRIETLITSRACYYCGRQRDGERVSDDDTTATPFLGLDRVDSDDSYVDGNVVPCCAACNYAKGVRSQVCFLNSTLQIARQHRFTVSPYSGVSLEAPF